MTVITTVGYGHATYQTNAELLYACFLELIATMTQAVLITVMTNIFKHDRNSSKALIDQRLNEAREWLVFKVER